MRIADVCGLSLVDVLERVDLMDAIAVDQWLETHPALPNCKEPWPHDNPPIGTWRLDPVFGQFEVLAARDVGAPRIPAWFSETIPTGAPRWRSMWLGAVYWDAYATRGPIVFTDAY
jgi:hypothetical protein